MLQASGNPLLYITIMGVSIFIFTVYRSLTQISIEDTRDALSDNNKPDIIITNPRIQVFNSQGIPAYNIQAAYIHRYTHQDRSLLNKPEIELLDITGNIIWKLSGNQIEYTSRQLVIKGNVKVLSLQQQPAIKIRTQQLEYDVGNETITIPVDADIIYGSSFIKSGSSSIDIKQKLLNFNNKVAMSLNVPSL